MSLTISVMASAGAMTMAAIKRDRGEVTSGTLIEGHGGVLSRIDSHQFAVCFAAPVFYHVTRYFFGAVIGSTRRFSFCIFQAITQRSRRLLVGFDVSLRCFPAKSFLRVVDHLRTRQV